MNKPKLEIKIAFIAGLKDIVLNEISRYPNFHIIREGNEPLYGDFIYFDFIKDFKKLTTLRSILRAYIVTQDSRYNPRYILNHKSILDSIISIIFENQERKFKTFRIFCAGTNSPIIRRIAEYIKTTYNITEAEEADFKIHIIKTDKIWEVGAEITPRPLSLRNYRTKHVSGLMDPTIAYAVNSLCDLEYANSYLNVFSGSATLLIEANQCYPNLKHLVGFDNNKKILSLSYLNVKKARLIKKIQLEERNIFDNPDLGRFDVITSDLPFGMSISKNEDLEKLYQYFIKYCQKTLNPNGRLAIYTSKHEILEEIISKSQFEIIKTLNLKFLTSVNAYLRPKIFLCRFGK